MAATRTKSITKTLCECCEEAISGEALLGCAGCSAQYHRACRLGAGRCVREGCARSAGLTRKGPKEESLLDVDVGPYLWGAAVAVPFAAVLSTIAGRGGVSMPLVFPVLVVLIGFVIGALRARYV